MTLHRPFIVDDRDRGLFRVHRQAFVSDEVLRLERELIFDRTWLYVGHESEIPEPNDFHTRRVGGRSAIFVRDRKGQPRVLLNTCRHRGAEVCRERTGKKKIFTCFYHGWAYDNAGSLVSVPGGDSYGSGFDRAELPLHQPRCASYRGFVFATFGAETPALEEYLADARYLLDLIADQSSDGMEIVAGTHNYSMRANWKLLMENSCDGYHGMTVHQTYFEMMTNLGVTPPMPGAKGGPGRGIDLGNGHAVAESPELGMPIMNDDVLEATRARRRDMVERFGEAHATQMLNTTRNTIVFPSLAIIDLNFGIQIRTMYPVAPDRTEITGWQMMPRDVADPVKPYRIDNALTFWGPAGLATPDDVEGLEQCQSGFSAINEVGWSDISRGMDSDQPTVVDELQMRAFWRQWNARLTGGHAEREGTPYDASYRVSNAGGNPMSAPHTVTVPADLLARIEVEDFLYREAALLDEWRLEEWLDLFTLDCVYEVPATDLPDGDPARTFALIHDGRPMLEQRVIRLKKPTAHAEFPHSRTRRLLTNVRLLGSTDEEVMVGANFQVVRVRRGVQVSFVGRYEYVLRRTGGGLLIRHRKAILDQDTLDAQGKISIIL